MPRRALPALLVALALSACNAGAHPDPAAPPQGAMSACTPLAQARRSEVPESLKRLSLTRAEPGLWWISGRLWTCPCVTDAPLRDPQDFTLFEHGPDGALQCRQGGGLKIGPAPVSNPISQVSIR